MADAVFYQIFPDRFSSSPRVVKPGPLEPWDSPPTTFGFKGGDLLGIVEHLDYLADLGVNALYLTPVFASASNHRYHTYDYFQVDPLLGGNDALRELLDACHGRDMRVVLDGVFNHSGRGFWPFHHVVENGAASPYVDWFYIDKGSLASGRPLRPYPAANERRLGYEAWWGLPALPKLNTNNPGMREHLMSAAEHWLRFGIDGWRLDVAAEIDAGFWREFRQRVRAVNPDAYIVAEIWREEPGWVRGDTFDALMNYPLTEALLSFVTYGHLDMGVAATQNDYREFVRPINAQTFAGWLDRVMTIYPPRVRDAQLNLLGSHDTARFVTVAGGDRASLRLALLATMTLPGAPCIYYGDEVGVEGRQDPDCRRSFPWNEQAWDSSLRDFTKAAIALRHGHDVLRHGEYRTLAAAGMAVAYGRYTQDAAGIVVINAGNETATLQIPADFFPGTDFQPVSLLGWEAPRVAGEGSSMSVELGGRSAAVLLSRVDQ